MFSSPCSKWRACPPESIKPQRDRPKELPKLETPRRLVGARQRITHEMTPFSHPLWSPFRGLWAHSHIPSRSKKNSQVKCGFPSQLGTPVAHASTFQYRRPPQSPDLWDQSVGSRRAPPAKPAWRQTPTAGVSDGECPKHFGLGSGGSHVMSLTWPCSWP